MPKGPVPVAPVVVVEVESEPMASGQPAACTAGDASDRAAAVAAACRQVPPGRSLVPRQRQPEAPRPSPGIRAWVYLLGVTRPFGWPLRSRAGECRRKSYHRPIPSVKCQLTGSGGKTARGRTLGTCPGRSPRANANGSSACSGTSSRPSTRLASTFVRRCWPGIGLSPTRSTRTLRSRTWLACLAYPGKASTRPSSEQSARTDPR